MNRFRFLAVFGVAAAITALLFGAVASDSQVKELSLSESNQVYGAAYGCASYCGPDTTYGCSWTGCLSIRNDKVLIGPGYDQLLSGWCEYWNGSWWVYCGYIQKCVPCSVLP